MIIETIEHWLTVEWYYKWFQVQPLWNELTTNEVRLPLITHDSTQGYELQTFPVCGPQHATVQLQVSWYAAINTTTRMVSAPQCCIR